MEGVVRSRIDLCRRGCEFDNLTLDYTGEKNIRLLGSPATLKNETAEKASGTLSRPSPRSTYLSWVVRERAPFGGIKYSQMESAMRARFTWRNPPRVRDAEVKYIALDTSSPRKYAKFRGAFPLLVCCALGPVHLAIAVGQFTSAYTSELAISVRQVLSKFSPVENGAAAAGTFYNGEPPGATSSEDT